MLELDSANPAAAERLGLDLAGIIDSIDLPIVVVGRDVSIVRFNVAAATMLRLTTSDIGRPLREIQLLAEMTVEAEEMCTQVIRGGASSQRRVQNRNGSWFLIRFASYLKSDHAAAGAVLTFTNVTALHASVQQAVYEREYTKAILNAVSESLLVLGPDLRVQTANRAFYTMFQVSRDATQQIGLYALGNRQWDQPRLRTLLQETVSNNRPFEGVEIEHEFPVIGRRTMLLSGRPISHENTHRRLILLAMEDITERKRAHEALRSKDAELEVISNQTPFMLARVGGDLRYRYVSHAYAQMLGRKPDEIVGELVVDVIGEATYRTVLPYINAALQGQHVQYETDVQIGNTGRRFLHVDYVPNRNDTGQVVGWVASIVDITERKRAEEALRASEERFRHYFELGLVGMAITSPTKGCIEVNDRLCEILGYTRSELLQMRWVEFSHPDDLANDNAHFDRVQSGEVDGYSIDKRYIRKDGEIIYTQLSVKCVRRGDGSVDHFVAILQDITERKRAEEALREADRRKDEFLATLAHELRNPLAPIRNSLDIMRVQGNMTAAAARQHEMMERQVTHMVRLVDDLLEVSRITHGTIELRKELVELSTAVYSAIETSKPFVEAAGHKLSMALPAEPLWLCADPIRLAQVFANLLNNAAKYTEGRGQIGVTVRREGNDVLVSVRDTGIGIPADMLPRIFDMFVRVDHPWRHAQGGLGIGLTLVRTLVQLHDGSVEARSEGEGKGCEIVVRLPLVEQGLVRPQTTAHAYVSTASHGRRVLVIDDNRDAADSLGVLLRSLGNEVHIAYDGALALEAITQHRPVIVFLDLGMPEVNGYEVARRVRSQAALRDVKLVALTGWGQENDRRRSRDAGFDKHLVKPVSLDTLQVLLDAP